LLPDTLELSVTIIRTPDPRTQWPVLVVKGDPALEHHGDRMSALELSKRRLGKARTTYDDEDIGR
jgi:hypothetical protein